MYHKFTVTYTPQLVKSATFHFWRRAGFLKKLLIYTFIAAGYAVYVSTTGDRPVSVGAFGVLLAFLLSMPVLIYFVHLRHAMDKLRKMDPPSGEVRIGDDSIAIRASSGAAEIPWHTIEYVWTFADVWLVFIGKDNYFTLPTGPMDDEAKAFIQRMVTQSGAKFR